MWFSAGVVFDFLVRIFVGFYIQVVNIYTRGKVSLVVSFFV